MGNLINLSGATIGRLFVVCRDSAKAKHGEIRWVCLCTCGNIHVAEGRHLNNRDIQSCGCLRSVMTGHRVRIHGKSRSREYISWCSMKARCYRKENNRYYAYGGRGITVCDRWLHSFENFYRDMGLRPKNTTLDRINVNGNYEPENCRWADSATQQANKRVHGALAAV